MVNIKVLDLKFDNNGKINVVHPAVIYNEKDMILVDAGYPFQIQQILDEAKRLEIDLNRLRKIIITHHDYDHIGSLMDIKEKFPTAQVLSSKIQSEYISGVQPFLRTEGLKKSLEFLEGTEREIVISRIEAHDSLRRCPVDRYVSDNEIVSDCGETTIIETPGHMPGHISVYVKSEKTLITGDAMNIFDDELKGANPDFTFDMPTAIQSIKKFSELDIENVICYHGGKYQSDTKKALQKLIDRI